MSKRQRLDQVVIERGLFPSRQIAQAAIIDGVVLVNGEKITKPGQNIDVLAKVELIPSFVPRRFVSRGGLKLERAISEFSLVVKDRVCLDIGASTGGFTDCLLQYGAKRIYAIDVGYGQLDWKLRNDARVVLKERQNIRNLSANELYGAACDEFATLAVVDVSFISLRLILPDCARLLSQDRAELICLIKPQFEAGKASVGKKGVVKSAQTHIEVIDQVIAKASQLSLFLLGLTYSPVTGPAGNLEFLVHLERNASAGNISVQDVVEKAHEDLIAGKQ